MVQVEPRQRAHEAAALRNERFGTDCVAAEDEESIGQQALFTDRCGRVIDDVEERVELKEVEQWSLLACFEPATSRIVGECASASPPSVSVLLRLGRMTLRRVEEMLAAVVNERRSFEADGGRWRC